MDNSASLVLLIFLFMITAFCSATEMAIASINRIRIKSRAENYDKKAIKILELLENRENSITKIVVLNNIVNIAIPTISTIFFTEIMPLYGALVSAILMTILILIFGEIIPKSLGNKYAEKYLNTMVGFVNFVMKLITPVAILFILINKMMFKLLETDSADEEEMVELEDEILTMIEESSLEGKIEDNEEELIRNAIEFNDTRVEEIMQPKRNIFMLNSSLSNEEMLKQMSEMRYSRVPVYSEDKDNIIGIVSEREFMMEYIINKNVDIHTILRDVKFIPDTMKISKLLPELQTTKSQMAIVIDERATVIGIVTVEDILEELVGEIYDEHDDVVDIFTKIDENVFEVIGEITISEFNQLYETRDIESESSESTLAGYVIELAERLPNIGEVFSDSEFTFEVTEIVDNKIEKIITRFNDAKAE